MRFLGGLAVAAALTVVGCSGDEPPQPISSMAGGAVTARPPSEGEWEPTPTGSSQMTPADVKAAPALAYDFVERFAGPRPGEHVDAVRWHARLAELATPDLAAELALIDPVENREALPDRPWGRPDGSSVAAFELDRLVVGVETGASRYDERIMVTLVKYAGNLRVSNVAAQR